jgi:hypothetical protein
VNCGGLDGVFRALEIFLIFEVYFWMIRCMPLVSIPEGYFDRLESEDTGQIPLVSPYRR